MVGLRDLARAFKDVKIYAISPDPVDASRTLIKKIEADRKGPLGYSLLSDPQSNVIDRYGLRDPEYAHQKVDGVPHPTVLVLDRDGRIRWMKVESDYRERPSVEEVGAALDAFD